MRTFSMSAGLAASTVTPGSTPPEASRTVPVKRRLGKDRRGEEQNDDERQTLQSGSHRGRFPFQLVGKDGDSRGVVAASLLQYPRRVIVAKKNTGRENPCQIPLRQTFA